MGAIAIRNFCVLLCHYTVSQQRKSRDLKIHRDSKPRILYILSYGHQREFRSVYLLIDVTLRNRFLSFTFSQNDKFNGLRSGELGYEDISSLFIQRLGLQLISRKVATACHFDTVLCPEFFSGYEAP
jgi:hypothetical protein